MTFKVTIQPAGAAFDVARDEAILPAAIRAGVGLPYGCRDGACGSCKSRLLEGRVIHGAHQLKALSVAEEEAGFILTCCATPQTDCVVEARSVPGAGEFPVQKMPARVQRIERPAPDVAIVTLQLPANVAFKYRAGQYLEFILRDGARRSYSMANAPHTLQQQPAVELHIRHMPGGRFTDHVFGAMKDKEILRVEGPFGSFFLREDSAKPIVLLASGTGFAPIKAMLEDAFAHGLQRPAHLYWGVRHAGELYLATLVRGWARERPGFGFSAVYSHEAAGGERHGLVHAAVLEDVPDLGAYDIYVSGPPALVAAARASFPAQGADPERLFSDSFEMARR